MKWIKASERLPEVLSEMIIEHNGQKGIGTLYDQSETGDNSKLMIFFNGEDHFEDQFHLIRWLDEQAEPAEVSKIKQLEHWKKEASLLLDPIIEYGQNHPDMKLGMSCSKFVLNRAKRAEVLVKALEGVLNLKPLWMYPVDVPEELMEEAVAMSKMEQSIIDALEQYKKETPC